MSDHRSMSDRPDPDGMVELAPARFGWRWQVLLWDGDRWTRCERGWCFTFAAAWTNGLFALRETLVAEESLG